MTRTKSTFLAVVAILLAPMAANATLIEIESTIDVSFVSGLASGFDNYSNILLGENVVISEGDTVDVRVDFSGTQVVTATDLESFYYWLIVASGFSSNFSIVDAFGELVGATGFNPGPTESSGAAHIGPEGYELPGSTVTFSGYNFGFTVDSLVGGTSEYNRLWWVSEAAGYSVSGTRDIGSEGTSITYTTVPEPGTLALFGIGLLGIAAGRRRQKI